MTTRASIRWAGLALTGKPREEIALEESLLTGFAVFRWAAWTWAAVVFGLNIANIPSPAHPGAGIALLAVALAWTTATSVIARRRASMLLDRWALGVETVIAMALVFADWWVYGRVPHSQSLGTMWPLAAIFTAGVAYGVPGGATVGFVIGLTRSVGDVVFFQNPMDHGDHQLAASGTIVAYTLAGSVAGFLTNRLREAEREIAVARAREEVARTLHDGVLQTLAVVQRRSTDAELVDLAREQEHELREFLFVTKPAAGAGRGASSDLAAALRQAAADAERRHHLRVQVVATDDLDSMPDRVTKAVAGAVGEALNNAAKHGGAAHVTVFAEPTDDGGVFCSVKDDGNGFDPAEAREGIGITRSIRGRIAEIGGRVDIDGRPGRGAEVRIHVP